MRRASLMPMRPGLTLSAVAPRSRNWTASLSEAQAESTSTGIGLSRDQLGELIVGLQLAGVLGDLGAFAGDDADVLGGLGARVGAVGVDVEIDGVADGGADLAQRGDVRLDALAALDLQRAEAVSRHDLGRLARHLPRAAAASRTSSPRRSARPPSSCHSGLPACCRPQRPARIVDQHLGQDSSRGSARAGWLTAAASPTSISCTAGSSRSSSTAASDRGETPDQVGLQRRLGHADGAVIADDPEEDEHGAVLDGIEPLTGRE